MSKQLDYDDVTVQTIIYMYQSGLSINTIVDEIEGTNNRKVREVLKNAGVLGDHKGKPSITDLLDSATLDAIVEDYYNDMPMRELIDKYRLTGYSAFYSIRDQLGLKARKYTPEAVQSRLQQIDQAIEFYKQGAPIWWICEETGIQQVKLHQELHRRKVPMRRVKKWTRIADK